MHALLAASARKTVHDTFHSTAFVDARDVLILLAIVFWLGLAYWTNRDARRRIDDSFLVFMATLLGLVPFVGPIVYLLLRPAESLADVRARYVELQALENHLARARPTCPVCSTTVEPEYLACPVCATRLRQACLNCAAPLEPLWQTCPYCTSSVEPSALDLDAALTAEAKTLASLEEVGGDLVIEPEPWLADA